MKAKEVAMTAALAFIIVLFFGLLIDAIYKSPEYGDFCDREFIPLPLNEESLERKEISKDLYEECNNKYEAAREHYSRNIFFILIPIGAILIILGIYLKQEILASGSMYGGILVLIYGSLRAFPSLSKIWRVIMIFIILCILIFITLKKLNKK